jgi:hypothetical protein
MDHVKGTNVVFGLEHMVYEGLAHLADFFHELRMQLEAATVVMDSVDALVLRLTSAHAGEDVNFMALPLQRSCQFGDVYRYATHWNRVQRFPC